VLRALRFIGGGGGGFFARDGGGGGGAFFAPVLPSVDQLVPRDGMRPDDAVGESDLPFEWTLLSSSKSVARLPGVGRRATLASAPTGSVGSLDSRFGFVGGEKSRGRIILSSVVTDRWYTGLEGDSLTDAIRLMVTFGAGSSTVSKRSEKECEVFDRDLASLRSFAELL